MPSQPIDLRVLLRRSLKITDQDIARDHRFLLLGAGLAVCTGGALARFGPIALAPIVLMVAVVIPLSTSSVSVFATLLAILPDSPILLSVSNLAVTPRLLLLFLLLCHVTAAIVTKRIRLDFAFPYLWAIYGAVVCAGAFVNDHPQAIVRFALLAVIPYGLGSTLGRYRSLLGAVIKGILFGTCILIAVVIVEFIRHKAFFAPVYDVAEYSRVGSLRANAGWVHPLALGMFFCLTAFLLIEAMTRYGMGATVAAAVALATAVFMTQERSPLLGLAAGTLVYIALQTRSRARSHALVALSVMIAVVLLIPGARSTAFREFLSQSVASEGPAASNVEYRRTLFELGVNAVESEPVVGFGYGTGANVQGNPNLAAFLHRDLILYQDIANWPLAIAIETGIAGLLIFATIIGAVIRRMIQARRLANSVFTTGAIAGLVAALVTSLGVSAAPASMIFLFILGLYAAGCEQQSI